MISFECYSNQVLRLLRAPCVLPGCTLQARQSLQFCSSDKWDYLHIHHICVADIVQTLPQSLSRPESSVATACKGGQQLTGSAMLHRLLTLQDAIVAAPVACCKIVTIKSPSAFQVVLSHLLWAHWASDVPGMSCDEAEQTTFTGSYKESQSRVKKDCTVLVCKSQVETTAGKLA